MSESLLDRIGVSGYNKPKRTTGHPTNWANRSKW